MPQRNQAARSLGAPLRRPPDLLPPILSSSLALQRVVIVVELVWVTLLVEEQAEQAAAQLPLRQKCLRN